MAPAPRPPTGARPRSACSLRTARCSRMRSFTSSQAVVVLVEDARRPRPRRAGPRTARPRAARRRCPARCGSSRARGSARSSARACRSRGRPPCAPPRAGRARPPGAVVVGLVPVAGPDLAQLLADGLELAPQQELALGLLHALFDVGLDPLAQRQVGQDLAGPGDDQAQARRRRRWSPGPRPSAPATGRGSTRPCRRSARARSRRPAARPSGRHRGSTGCSPARPGTRGPARRPRRRPGPPR